MEADATPRLSLVPQTRDHAENLAHVEINGCDISGLKINGVLIEELIKGTEA